MAKLYIKGANQNNLKDISVSFEHNSVTCISGPSGAGKSSLVFDTIYSEAQRRYIETFSPYARQFLERLPEPEVRQILNLPAAIAVGQANPVRNSRSTVGTLSEITCFARMLFYRNARPYCDKCGIPVKEADWRDIWAEVVRAAEQNIRKAWLAAPVTAECAKALVRDGYHRIIHKGRELDLSMEPGFLESGSNRGTSLNLVIDRFLMPSLRRERLRESAELAFSTGNGTALLILENNRIRRFSSKPACSKCGRHFDRPSPYLFSFNSPNGACPECRGFGKTAAIDWNLVVPDDSRSILEGAIKPIENRPREKKRLLSWCESRGLNPQLPWKRLAPEEREAVLLGSGRWRGIKAIFDRLEKKRYKPHIRMLLARYRTYMTCPRCGGSRFRQLASCYRLAGINIAEFYALSSKKALSWCRDLAENTAAKETPMDKASECLLAELERRLSLITDAGLGYLTLDRQSRTLSGGELSRLCISRAVSTRLSETLYCLDEPSSGLHPRDVKALTKILRGLKNAGNTLITVDNDRQVRRNADRVVEMGPASGTGGGLIIKPNRDRGRVSEYEKCYSLQGENLPERKTHGRFLEIKGAAANNLKDVSCRIPLKAVSCICGVSGSGKSSLVEECLYRGILRLKGLSSAPPGKFRRITGWESISRVRMVDQEPVSRNPRACPGTFLKALDPVRKLLSESEKARAGGLRPGYFSVNVQGGRCEQCRGQGLEVIEMQFLPDVLLPCPACRGKRFRQEALDYSYRGRNISEILAMTLDEAWDFFQDSAPFQKAAAPAKNLGLGYLLLGQPLNSLSAGEAQRLKIARSISGDREKNCLFILDEPTRGLHRDEIKRLMVQLRRLAQDGHTIIVVEHDMEVFRFCDWVIELGPEGGEAGGEKIFEGTARKLLEQGSTPTSAFLRDCEMARNNEPLRPAGGKQGISTGPGTAIEIRGARHHNLKDLDISIPKGRFVVITGVSGSGKSSLAFDLIHREAQRRYLESLPSYMKQFIRLHENFDVDSISGLSPSVAIEQKVSRGGSMSTVATLTEAAHYLRLLYAHLSRPVCPSCGRKMQNAAFEDILAVFLSILERGEVLLVSPRVRARKGWHQPEIQKAFTEGASMVRADGRFYRSPENIRLSRYREHDIDWVWGPVEKGSCSIEGLKRLLAKALSAGSGMLSLLDHEGREEAASLKYFCPHCRISTPDPDPLLFSFHSASGRCPDCLGSGRKKEGGPCPACEGTRLSDPARTWKIAEKSIDNIFAMETGDAKTFLEGWLDTLPFPEERREIGVMLIRQILNRLSMLENLGLGYLPLDRAGNTLSGGEAQRIRLAVQADSNLTGLTIVLDEPTIGLHPSDNLRLIDTLSTLRDRGNTIIVVEHDEETIRAADWIIDLGPGGGKRGGGIVAQGPLKKLIKQKDSRTAAALGKEKTLSAESGRIERAKGWLRFRRINRFNLRDLDIKIPCGAMTVITGVSGSGKSTLLNEVIWKALSETGDAKDAASGAEQISRTIRIDHTPIGKTPRSCPATFAGFWSDIRFLFSRTRAARIRGLGPGHFSYNTRGGRCEACGGLGRTWQKLSLLPDVSVICEECGGRRFKQEILDIKWKGKTITEVLDMTVEEAARFFQAVPGIRRKLGFLEELGLGYIGLGQPSPTLSGGEAQRLKLAKELSRPAAQGTLYLLDEPTVGLHMEDVERLSRCLGRLADMGNTVIVVEHNLDFMTRADWFIDLGPGGGRKGGRLLFQGRPGDFLGRPQSNRTARALSRFIGRHQKP